MDIGISLKDAKTVLGIAKKVSSSLIPQGKRASVLLELVNVYVYTSDEEGKLVVKFYNESSSMGMLPFEVSYTLTASADEPFCTKPMPIYGFILLLKSFVDDKAARPLVIPDHVLASQTSIPCLGSDLGDENVLSATFDWPGMLRKSLIPNKKVSSPKDDLNMIVAFYMSAINNSADTAFGAVMSGMDFFHHNVCAIPEASTGIGIFKDNRNQRHSPAISSYEALFAAWLLDKVSASKVTVIGVAKAPSDNDSIRTYTSLSFGGENASVTFLGQYWLPVIDSIYTNVITDERYRNNKLPMALVKEVIISQAEKVMDAVYEILPRLAEHYQGLPDDFQRVVKKCIEAKAKPPLDMLLGIGTQLFDASPLAIFTPDTGGVSITIEPFPNKLAKEPIKYVDDPNIKELLTQFIEVVGDAASRNGYLLGLDNSPEHILEAISVDLSFIAAEINTISSSDSTMYLPRNVGPIIFITHNTGLSLISQLVISQYP